jgi:Tfp pilus assembly protein PilN
LSLHLHRGGISVVYGARYLSRIKIMGSRSFTVEEGKYPSPEAFASKTHLALNDLMAMKADVTLIVPKEWTIVKTVDLPLVVKDNLSDVIFYELDRLTPLSPDKAYFDYQVIGEDEGRIKIILAALKTDMLDPYLHALTQRGIHVNRVIVSLSAFGALSHHVQERKTTLFIDVGSGAYEGGLMDNGRLTASFTGSLSAGGESDKGRVVAAEINPLIEAMKKRDETPSVVVAARTGSRPLLAEHINAPVRFLGEMDLRLRFFRRENVIPYTALGGVLESLKTRLRGMNLLDKGVHKPLVVPMAPTAFLLLVLAGLGLFYIAASIQTGERKVEAVEREIAARKGEVRKIEALKKDRLALQNEIKAIEQFKASKPSVLILLKELTLILPKNAWLTRVHVTDTALDIEGYAISATNLLAKLEASRYFKKVEFSAPTFRDARLNADRFTIKMEIEGLPEEKKKNEKKQ